MSATAAKAWPMSDAAREVLALAPEEARALNHDSVGTEHLLLGMLRVDTCMAARALQTLGISLRGSGAQVVAMVGRGPAPVGAMLPMTDNATQALDVAYRESVRLGHPEVGTGHLLLGLISSTEGIGVQVLMRQGAGPNTMRARVENLLAGEESEPMSPVPSRERERTAGIERRETTDRRARETVSDPTVLAVERRAVTTTGTAGEPAASEDSGDPRCPSCAGRLVDNALFTTIPVRARDGSQIVPVRVVYCACGHTLGTAIPPEGS